MEFLVAFEVNPPEETPESEVVEREEAESAAERACLEAQLDVEQRAAVAASEVQRLLAAERDRTSALRLELERERAGLDTFYRYAAELGLVPDPVGLRFYEAGRPMRHLDAEPLARHD